MKEGGVRRSKSITRRKK